MFDGSRRGPAGEGITPSFPGMRLAFPLTTCESWASMYGKRTGPEARPKRLTPAQLPAGVPRLPQAGEVVAHRTLLAHQRGTVGVPFC